MSLEIRVKQQQKEIEVLYEEVDRLRHLYSGAMKAVRGLTEENERLKMMYENTGSIMNRRHQIDKIERYEKVLKECIEQKELLEFLDKNDWATQEDYFVKLAKEALYK